MVEMTMTRSALTSIASRLLGAPCIQRSLWFICIFFVRIVYSIRFNFLFFWSCVIEAKNEIT